MALGQLDESKPKEMFSVLPVVNCKAKEIPADGAKEDKSLYKCPIYKTIDRGTTFVTFGQLKTPTKFPPRKWILAGVGMVMDVEGVSDEVKKAADKK
jgi:dynein heavy chain